MKLLKVGDRVRLIEASADTDSKGIAIGQVGTIWTEPADHATVRWPKSALSYLSPEDDGEWVDVLLDQLEPVEQPIILQRNGNTAWMVEQPASLPVGQWLQVGMMHQHGQHELQVVRRGEQGAIDSRMVVAGDDLAMLAETLSSMVYLMSTSE